MPLLALPPEILGHVASFATTPCLAALCGTSTTLRDVVLPILYSHLDCQSLTGALRLFRACTTAKDQRLYVHQYAREVKAISLPTRQASREVKASIAFSLARAISEGCFPNLQCLCWTFSHQRDHSYDSDRNARMFDEPLWRALNERYATFERLEVDRSDYQAPDSALWRFATKCKQYITLHGHRRSASASAHAGGLAAFLTLRALEGEPHA